MRMRSKISIKSKKVKNKVMPRRICTLWKGVGRRIRSEWRNWLHDKKSWQRAMLNQQWETGSGCNDHEDDIPKGRKGERKHWRAYATYSAWMQRIRETLSVGTRWNPTDEERIFGSNRRWLTGRSIACWVMLLLICTSRLRTARTVSEKLWAPIPPFSFKLSGSGEAASQASQRSVRVK